MKKTVIVTGGSRGIGRAIVEVLASEGYNVVLNYNKSEKEAREIREKLIRDNCNVEIFKADVSKRNEVKELVKFALAKFNSIDILINNAGIAQTKLFTDITDEDWYTILNTNLTSVFYMSGEVAKIMINKKNGCIINISSIWGLVGGACEVHYSASKGGINAFTKALAKELGPSGIRVNAIAPGCIDTDMNKGITKEEWNQIIEESPIKKIGKPIDIAKCVKWIIEDEFTTGQIISPNGGWIIT